MTEVSVLSVNGEQHTVDPGQKTVLLDVLRGQLGLKGTRFGCGVGACGACTVLVDDRPTQSCTTPVSALKGCQITTIEGAGSGADPAPVRQVFLDLQAAQCGYCINGYIMSITGLFARSPVPDRAEILAYLDERHICRCGAHTRIIRVVDTLWAARRADP